MKKGLKTFFVIIAIFGVVMWHHQATLFQRHVRETLQVLKEVAGHTIQLGDMTFSKYLFKVEFKKPQIDLNLKSIDEIKIPSHFNNNPLLKFVIQKVKSYPIETGFTYRLADKLVISYNVFWHELTVTSSGDGEFNLYHGEEKTTLTIPDHSDVNQGKVKISLPAPYWLQQFKKIFSKAKSDRLLGISSTCRNVKIIDSNTQESFFNQDFSAASFKIGSESRETEKFYTLDMQVQTDNASFSPHLIKIWQAFEPHVVGGMLNKTQDYKIRVEQTEFWSFVNALLVQFNLGQWNGKALTTLIPTLYLEGKTSHHNQALTSKDDYAVDYQPSKNFFKAHLNYNFEAGPAWTSYVEKILHYYVAMTNQMGGDSMTAAKEGAITPWLQTLLAKFAGKGEIKTSFSLEVKDWQTDKPQGQGFFKIGQNNCSLNMDINYLTPPVIKVTFDFEDYEKLLTKLSSYGSSVLEEMGNKTGEIVLTGIKNYLLEEIKKLSIIKNENNPLLRSVPIQFNTESQELEIANKPIQHEIMGIMKMLIGLANPTGLLESVKRLTPTVNSR